MALGSSKRLPAEMHLELDVLKFMRRQSRWGEDGGWEGVGGLRVGSLVMSIYTLLPTFVELSCECMRFRTEDSTIDLMPIIEIDCNLPCSFMSRRRPAASAWTPRLRPYDEDASIWLNSPFKEVLARYTSNRLTRQRGASLWQQLSEIMKTAEWVILWTHLWTHLRPSITCPRLNAAQIGSHSPWVVTFSMQCREIL
jgi:hypothetical protein